MLECTWFFIEFQQKMAFKTMLTLIFHLYYTNIYYCIIWKPKYIFFAKITCVYSLFLKTCSLISSFTRDKLNDVECDLIMGGIAIVIKASKYWIRDWKWTIQDYVSIHDGQKWKNNLYNKIKNYYPKDWNINFQKKRDQKFRKLHFFSRI